MKSPAYPDVDKGVADSRGNGRKSFVTRRTVILAVALAALNDYWVVQLEVVRYSFATYAAPFYNVLFTLFALTCLNFLVRRFRPRLALSHIELLTVYVMLSITSAVCSGRLLEFLVSTICYAHWFKTPENGWDALFVRELPRWLTVSDRTALEGFYHGGTSIYLLRNLKPWLAPALFWSVFVAAMVFTMLCISSALRKHWVESEKLTFPIIQLPLELAREDGALFRNRLMWAGFAIAGSLTLLAGIHYLYPNVPAPRIIRRDMSQYITSPPWTAVGSLMVGFYFFAIGLAYLMPLNLSFSSWFFFLLVKLELVLSAAMGWNELRVAGGGFDRAYPFVFSQSFGAYAGMLVTIIWTSRRYLRSVFRTAFTGRKELDESREAISYRAAIIGALAGWLVLAAFAWKMGMGPWVIAGFFAVHFALSVVVSRVRAELGFPVHDMVWLGPQTAMIAAAGTEALGPKNLIPFGLTHWFTSGYHSNAMPHQVEGLKIAERAGSPARQVFMAAVVAVVVAAPIGFWAILHNYYRLGGSTGKMEIWSVGLGADSWNTLADRLKDPTHTNYTSLAFVGVGFSISMVLGWLRRSFLWFPFHPLAYATAPSWGVNQLWVPLVIGSVCKFVTLRYGGLRAYRKALPFFFGLILGEIVVGSLWTLVGVVLGVPTYDFWPGKAN